MSETTEQPSGDTPKKRGGYRPGAGRPKGSKSAYTTKVNQYRGVLVSKLDDKIVHLIDALIALAMDERVSAKYRVDALKTLIGWAIDNSLIPVEDDSEPDERETIDDLLALCDSEE